MLFLEAKYCTVRLVRRNAALPVYTHGVLQIRESFRISREIRGRSDGTRDGAPDLKRYHLSSW